MEEKLRQFGLSSAEARVYASLSERGESTASEIAKGAHVKRSTAYVILFGDMPEIWNASEAFLASANNAGCGCGCESRD